MLDIRVPCLQFFRSILQVGVAATNALDVKGIKPAGALRRLRSQLASSDDRVAWRKKARVAAIMGSFPKSEASYKSGAWQHARPHARKHLCMHCKGVRHWMDYSAIVHGSEDAGFPPQLADILGWSNTFQCLGRLLHEFGQAFLFSMLLCRHFLQLLGICAKCLPCPWVRSATNRQWSHQACHASHRQEAGVHAKVATSHMLQLCQ